MTYPISSIAGSIEARETILPCDGRPFMGGHPNPKGRSIAKDWSGGKFASEAARKERVKRAGKFLGRDGFGRTGPAHSSSATSKGNGPDTHSGDAESKGRS
ncbi:hypothetical protein GCM10008942_22810 [Rhizomicrobium electricum]|uniref:Uncharacterized protein n=1 Tax=Rhizomicrobium electricum TaxID=480070 RepID=A0ABN1ETD7_9PROT